ncbi:MAG: SIS domain-containing protein [Candidatus Schekmanbacteria bacterium]|nr:SIS domain-containing protein [Candidatus Schekmanbacteria bacterium]
MCGIVGILSAAILKPAEPVSPEAVNRLCGEALAAAEQAGSCGELLRHARSSLERICLCDGPYEAGASWHHSALLREAAAFLSRLYERLVARREQAAGFREIEALNQERVLCQDLQWRIEHDVLGVIDDIRELAGGRGVELSPRAARSFWVISYLLRNLNRLEIRGRDSAGLSLLFSFDSPAARDQFVAERAAQADLAELLEGSTALANFTSGTCRLPAGSAAIVLTYKVAAEIGEMGDNARALRRAVQGDPLLLALAAAAPALNAIAHTRWASNGVISEENCHPMDNSCSLWPRADPFVGAVLNGDIDNFQELLRDFGRETGATISERITTDAKIIPLAVAQRYTEKPDMQPAFRHAVNQFEGSFAIAVHGSREPRKAYLAQRGSGQSLFVAWRPDCLAYASELYGLVELTDRFVKLEGERHSDPANPASVGQYFVLDGDAVSSGWRAAGGFAFSGRELGPAAPAPSEITTRDINIGGFRHFFEKEVTESVASVRKTLDGRYRIEGNGADGQARRVRFMLDHGTIPDEVPAALRARQIRRVLCIGQGTAAIAAEGVAYIMARYLGSRLGIAVEAAKATEVSGFQLAPDMRDTLVIAISQSGTTTDTNRTVDLLRGRGARALGIINRRQSALAFKCDGVFYTSDGRDIEMSVASTKAFYAQIVAGYLVALYLAERSGAIDAATCLQAVDELERLPEAMDRVLALRDSIDRVAREHAAKKRHWAVTGSGQNHIAACEIRIKLSELCYKSIAVDHLEDKKHIDLSSEPLVIVCAAGLDGGNLTDAVKEVAIFKAHKSVPVVIANRGAERFEHYGAAVVQVPEMPDELVFVLTTMVGHLFGYSAALMIDGQAQMLKHFRGELSEAVRRAEARGEFPWSIRGIRRDMAEVATRISRELRSGRMDGALQASTSAELTLLLRYLTGRLALDDLTEDFVVDGTPFNLVDLLQASLTRAVNELSRPIDAIKHQAKTVTVGISRTTLAFPDLFAPFFAELGATPADLRRDNMEILEAVAALVQEVAGSTVYAVSGLEQNGGAGQDARVTKERATGIAAQMKSRTESQGKLRGTKWLVVSSGSIFVGLGQWDHRPICIVPLFTGPPRTARLLLLHLRFAAEQSVAAKVRLLKAYDRRYEELVATSGEINVGWDDSLLAHLSIETLLSAPPEEAARMLQGTRR